MSKVEFLKYLMYLNGLFPEANLIANDKEVINDWYKNFKDMNLDQLEEIALNIAMNEREYLNLINILYLQRKIIR